MKFDKLTYTLGEMMGPPQKLTIQSDGEVRYESHSNISMPDRPEIGFYETRLSSADIERLQRGMASPPFEGFPDHWGRIASGDRYKRISVAIGSQMIEKMVGTREPVDPSLATLIAQLDQIVATVMAHPRRTLRIEVSHMSLDDSRKLTVDFALSNGGTEITESRNPVGLLAASGLSIRGWPDKPPAQFRSGEAFSVHVENVTEIGKSPSEAAAPTILTIGPADKVTFRALARLSAPGPQTYIVQLAYQNTAEEPGRPSLMIGELFSRSGKLSVPAAKMPDR